MSSNISETIAKVIAALPDNPAFNTPERDLTYRELGIWVAAIQQGIDAQGPREAPVIVLASDAVCSVAAMIGLMASGRIMVPLDADQSPHRLLQIIELVKPQLVLHDDGTAALLDKVDRQQALVRLNVQRDRLQLSTASSGMTVVEREADAPCYIYFTSGSTGQPKGIVGRLKSIAHFVAWEADELQLDEGVRISQLTSPAFDAVLRDIYTPLSVGGTICFPPTRKVLGDGPSFAAWLGQANVGVMHAVPSVLRVLLQAIAADPALKPAGLRHVCVAGEVLYPSDVELFRETLGTDVSLVNLYGPSETTMVKLFHRVDMAAPARASIPVGKAMPGARAIVVDARQKPCGVGMVGEIYIRTPYRSLGYFDRPDLTAEVFVPNPLSGDAEDLVYRTGDLGRLLDTGDIEFVGRRDRQVKINGVRLELAEIEGLARQSPAVTDIAVVERQVPARSSELVAYVVLAPGADTAQVSRHMLEHGSAAMLPQHLISLPALPRTVTGKVDYGALPAVDLSDSGGADGGPAPSTPLEVAVGELWQELLNSPGLPGIDARFFSLGGHSLLAMQLLSRIEASFGVSVSIREFLDSPTIRQLARLIETAFLEASIDEDLLSLMQERD